MFGKPARRAFSWPVAGLLFVSAWPVSEAQVQSEAHSHVHKRAITVDDAIGMARPATVAVFSPDGSRFASVWRKADSGANRNNYSLYLFRTAEVFSHSQPLPVLTMSSSSNRDAIAAIKWLPDSETITFIGERSGESPQVYAFHVRTHHLESLTHSPTPIHEYDITPDSNTILYSAEVSTKNEDSEQIRRQGRVVTLQSLGELTVPSLTVSTKLLVQRRASSGSETVMREAIRYFSVSPDGKYGIAKTQIAAEDLPSAWAQYTFPQNDYLHTFFHGAKGLSPLMRYVLIDLHSKAATQLLDAPVLSSSFPSWRGQSLLIARTYLPLDVADASKQESRKVNTYCAEIKIPTHEIREVDQELCSQRNNPPVPLNVSIKQDLNTPPQLFVTDSKSDRKAVLLDLNRAFQDLDFGKVEKIVWKAQGVELVGGLYFPPDYNPAKRYPLVIQTHGFEDGEFSMDGMSEWSSGFAARPLAAQGFLVLQAQEFKDPKDHDRVLANRSLGATDEEAAKNFSALAYQSAIDGLDQEGMIDRARVGISGFSRTVCFVAYTLTRTKTNFAAAALTDGIDCGYFQYVSFSPITLATDLNDLNGGLSPFGEQGLKDWVQKAPGFNLDKVHTPVRLISIGRGLILEEWEWFVGLSNLNKPVDFIEIPDGTHILQKPWDRRIAMQGLVDWFRFWLKGEEDSDPAKAAQYARWRKLRRMQEENSKQP